jgi:hypothetical protein
LLFSFEYLSLRKKNNQLLIAALSKPKTSDKLLPTRSEGVGNDQRKEGIVNYMMLRYRLLDWNIPISPGFLLQSSLPKVHDSITHQLTFRKI